jgi:two-component system chemotaxis response regulator CheB
MDIEMPEMNGIEAVRALRRTNPRLPVVMFSTLTERGASATLDALAAGASDYVTKPSNVGSFAESQHNIREQLIPRLKALTGARRPVRGRGGGAAAAHPDHTAPAHRVPSVCWRSAAPPAGPTRSPPCCRRSPPTCRARGRRAAHAAGVHPAARSASRRAVRRHRRGGRARRAAGARPGAHRPRRQPPHRAPLGTSVVVELSDDPPENFCRPAVDVLFRSVAAVYGDRVLAAVLTAWAATASGAPP